jgi:hypothetical protein
MNFDFFSYSETNSFKQDLTKHLWLCCAEESYLNNVLTKKKTREDIVRLLDLTIR